MRYVDIRKKRPSRWPWVIAVGIFALLAWGVTSLLAPPADGTGPDLGTTVADTQPPVAIPLVGRQPFTPPPRRELADLAPLGPEDAGETVWVHGEVVATDEDGYWTTDGSHILRVDSRADVRTGDIISAEGRLRAAELEPPEIAGGPGGSADSTGWTAVRTLRLVTDTAAGSTPGSTP